ncbi:hypothetical protein AKJ09_09620 [Labilithrix luteola]|uniref:Uncharacterized protein n=1 Tax=Labilithrix luteola TaxID=1391654 RepID=A0A0K1QBB0_9BACT|nr:hypothetical protein AKJ09_09620 [Labilithrix luteola]
MSPTFSSSTFCVVESTSRGSIQVDPEVLAQNRDRGSDWAGARPLIIGVSPSLAGGRTIAPPGHVDAQSSKFAR